MDRRSEEGTQMKRLKNWLLGFAAIVVMLGTSIQAAPTFTLNPVGGAIAGAPGAVVGWGFTITNNMDYLVATAVDFVITPPAPPIGVFTNYLTDFNFIVVGPSPESTSVSQSFD